MFRWSDGIFDGIYVCFTRLLFHMLLPFQYCIIFAATASSVSVASFSSVSSRDSVQAVLCMHLRAVLQGSTGCWKGHGPISKFAAIYHPGEMPVQSQCMLHNTSVPVWTLVIWFYVDL